MKRERYILLGIFAALILGVVIGRWGKRSGG
jgi:hypothetical protein